VAQGVSPEFLSSGTPPRKVRKRKIDEIRTVKGW
jgi:hypothetical protein